MSKNHTGALSCPLNFEYVNKHVNFSKKLEEWREEFYTDMIPMAGGYTRDETGPKSYYDYEQFEESFNSSIWVRCKREDGCIYWEDFYWIRETKDCKITWFYICEDVPTSYGIQVYREGELFDTLEKKYKISTREKKLKRILE